MRKKKRDVSLLSIFHHQPPEKNDGFNSEYYWFKLFKTSVIKKIYKYELSTPLQNHRYVHTGHLLLLQFSDCFGWISFSFLVTTLLLSSVKVKAKKTHFVSVRKTSWFGLKHQFWSTGSQIETVQLPVKNRLFCSSQTSGNVYRSPRSNILPLPEVKGW